jgi:hypothetical protein
MAGNVEKEVRKVTSKLVQMSFLGRRPTGGAGVAVMSTSVCSFPEASPPPAHPLLCNQPAACACPARSSCLDQSCESEARLPSAAPVALGWGERGAVGGSGVVQVMVR